MADCIAEFLTKYKMQKNRIHFLTLQIFIDKIFTVEWRKRKSG